MADKILQRGAEAVIFLRGNEIIKRRVKKSYRLPTIDESIRKLRTRSEAKLLEKASKLVNTPHVIKSDEKTKEIVMEFVDGKKLSESLDSFPLEKQKGVCKQIGTEIGKLHDAEVIHGDLTTSNMILVQNKKRSDKNDKVFFIDFGLGFISNKVEDMAVDLHLLKQALEAKHFTHWSALFVEVLRGYSHSKNSKKVLEQLKKVEARGRYKDSY